jgi:hypothetical protein
MTQLEYPAELEVRNIVCRGCFAILDVEDRFCRHCGEPTVGGENRPVGRLASPTATRSAWSESPWVVLPMLFLVLGPFGLPMLWRSRQLSRMAKTVATTIVAGITLLIFAMIWHSLNTSLAPLRELHTLR